MSVFTNAVVDLIGRYVFKFKFLVSLLQIKGVTYLRKFGSNPSTSTKLREVLDFYTGDTKVYNGWYDVNTQLYLIGDNAGDTTQVITITGIKDIDGNWTEVVENHQLNGTVAVNIGSWLRVYRIRVVSPHALLLGSVFVTTGQIVPIDSDTIAAAIKRNPSDTTRSNNTSSMTLLTVPYNKVALFEKVFVSSISNKTGQFQIEIRHKGGGWLSIADFTQETSAQFLVNYELIPPSTDVRVLSKYDSAGGKSASSLHVYFVDESKWIR